MVRALVIVVVALCGACGMGTAPIWSQANPETRMEFDPISRKFVFYSNDGRGLTADRLEAKSSGGAEFNADGLVITERSVENRIGNVEQMKIGVEMTKAVVDGIPAIVQAAGVAVKPFAPMNARPVDNPMQSQ